MLQSPHHLRDYLKCVEWDVKPAAAADCQWFDWKHKANVLHSNASRRIRSDLLLFSGVMYDAVWGGNAPLLLLFSGVMYDAVWGGNAPLLLLLSLNGVMYDAVWGGNAPLLLLLFNGDPVDITYAQLSPHVDAIVSCVYPAQATGEALYRMITMTGPHSVPAGRLPNTWPAVLHQVMATGWNT